MIEKAQVGLSKGFIDKRYTKTNFTIGYLDQSQIEGGLKGLHSFNKIKGNTWATQLHSFQYGQDLKFRGKYPVSIDNSVDIGVKVPEYVFKTILK